MKGFSKDLRRLPHSRYKKSLSFFLADVYRKQLLFDRSVDENHHPLQIIRLEKGPAAKSLIRATRYKLSLIKNMVIATNWLPVKKTWLLVYLFFVYSSLFLSLSIVPNQHRYTNVMKLRKRLSSACRVPVIYPVNLDNSEISNRFLQRSVWSDAISMVTIRWSINISDEAAMATMQKRYLDIVHFLRRSQLSDESILNNVDVKTHFCSSARKRLGKQKCELCRSVSLRIN